MKYTVIGSTGFIGSEISNYLMQSGENECIGVGSHMCDLTDAAKAQEVLPSLVRDAVVVYAAGIPRLRSNTLEAMIANISMLFNLLNVFKTASPEKVIFLSSVEVYGAPKSLPIVEDSKIKPETMYGIGKVTGELMLQASIEKIPLAILRLPGVYGIDDKGLGLIGKLMQCIRDCKEFTLLGNGLEQRDFLYSGDIPRAVEALAKTDFKKVIINLVSGKSHTVAEIMDMLFKRYGDCPVRALPGTTLPCHLSFDASMREKVIKGFEMTPLDKGIKSYGPGKREVTQ